LPPRRPKPSGPACPPARGFKGFRDQTLDRWSCARRVVGKAEQLVDGAGEPSPNPRVVVTNLTDRGSSISTKPLKPARDLAEGSHPYHRTIETGEDTIDSRLDAETRAVEPEARFGVSVWSMRSNPSGRQSL
jgi:hypothetical protein